MDEKMLTLKQESEIRERALKLKEEKKLRKIYPMFLFGLMSQSSELITTRQSALANL